MIVARGGDWTTSAEAALGRPREDAPRCAAKSTSGGSRATGSLAVPPCPVDTLAAEPGARCAAMSSFRRGNEAPLQARALQPRLELSPSRAAHGRAAAGSW